MSIYLTVGFPSSIDDACFPGFCNGGLRISIDGSVLTRYDGYRSGFANYDTNGEPLSIPEEYVGEYLDFPLDGFKEAIIRFQHGGVDRYEEIPVAVREEPGFSRIVLSFCGGEHIHIAFQPTEAEYGSYFPTEVTVGSAIDPDELYQEHIECFEDCIAYVENAHGDAEEVIEYMVKSVRMGRRAHRGAACDPFENDNT